MDQQRSEIVLSPNSWHAKLIKWVFGFGTEDFKNLCPYFWTLVASILVVIPVTPIKALCLALNWTIEKLIDLIEKGRERNFDRFIANLSKGELFALVCYKYGSESLRKKTEFDSKYRIIFDKIKINLFHYAGKTRSMSDLIDLICSRFEKDSKWEKWDKDFETEYNIRKQELEILSDKLRKKPIKKKKNSEIIGQITEATKYFIKTFLAIASFILMGIFSQIFIQVLIFLFTREAQDYITFLEILGMIITIVIFGLYEIWGIFTINEWMEFKEKKTIVEWILLVPAFPFAILYYLICSKILHAISYVLKGIAMGIIEGFKEYGGIFADYFDASYSDYCPGINWKNNNKK